MNALRSLGRKWFSAAYAWLAKAVEREPVLATLVFQLNSKLEIVLIFDTTRFYGCNITTQHWSHRGSPSLDFVFSGLHGESLRLQIFVYLGFLQELP